MTPDWLSLGSLSDLIIAWAEGEISEGRITELTKIDRITLRGLKMAAINRALKLCESDGLSEDGVNTVVPSVSSIKTGVDSTASSLSFINFASTSYFFFYPEKSRWFS